MNPSGEIILSVAQQRQQQAMLELLHQAMQRGSGKIPFSRFMELALYAPGLGYYAAGAEKFGAQGDFVTAPEISPYFSYCLAHQCAQVMEHLPQADILEFGAGSGIMAADILLELARLQRLPKRYFILELSAELQQRQRQTLQQKAPHLLHRVAWLQRLPTHFEGVVLANEVLDAMPVTVFRNSGQAVFERWVRFDGEILSLDWQPAGSELIEAVKALEARLGPFPAPYVSEINLNLAPWVQALAHSMNTGLVLLIDYGYEAAEYYHPQRHMGTLIAHYQHRAHDDVLLIPGLQDITASVDFSAVAEAAATAGMQLIGYAPQAQFLIGCGLDRMLAQLDPQQVGKYMDVMQKVKQLILPNEMGERFKVMALGKNLQMDLIGFHQPG